MASVYQIFTQQMAEVVSNGNDASLPSQERNRWRKQAFNAAKLGLRYDKRQAGTLAKRVRSAR